MKPLKYGLTEAAMEAARQIKFQPAIRNEQLVSQFATLSYDFKKGRGLLPYVPEREFLFLREVLNDRAAPPHQHPFESHKDEVVSQRI